ncbi:MAG: AMIN domain-containing protein [Desulfofustis sp.]|nr:AMIN domain-containing protein [Desulfofustis sp.]
MTRLAFICLFGLLLFQPFIAGAQNDTKAPAIDSITIRAQEGSDETVVIKLNGSYSPSIFRLDGELPRLVLDFYDVRYLGTKESIAGKDGQFVQGVRVGRHLNPLKTRVVVDIVPGSSYDYDQTFNVSNNSLEITFYPGIPGNQYDPGKPRIQVGKAKIVYGTAPVTDKEESAPAQPVVDKQETQQASAAQPEASQGVAARSDDAETQRKPESGAAQGPQINVDQLPLKSEEPISLPEKTEVPAADTEKPEVAVVEAEKPEVPAAETEKPEVPAAETEMPEVPAAETEKPGVPAAETEKPEVPVAETEKPEVPAAETGKTETAASDEAQPVLLDVSFEQAINNSETVLFKLSHFYPPLVFGIEKGAPRVVCDFHDAKIGADVPSQIEAGGKYVNRITVASLKDPDKVRVELELVPNHHYDLQQLFFKEDNLFVVNVKELAVNGDKK